MSRVACSLPETMRMKLVCIEADVIDGVGWQGCIDPAIPDHDMSAHCFFLPISWFPKYL
jgi:hypothetical protein